MNTLSISRKSFVNRRQAYSEILANGFLLIIYSILGLILLISVAYLVHVNQIAMKGYEIKKLESIQKQLSAKNKYLNSLATKAAAFENVSQSKVARRMIKAYQPLYIRGDTMTAKK